VLGRSLDELPPQTRRLLTLIDQLATSDNNNAVTPVNSTAAMISVRPIFVNAQLAAGFINPITMTLVVPR
jgi:hypothetical protein